MRTNNTQAVLCLSEERDALIKLGQFCSPRNAFTFMFIHVEIYMILLSFSCGTIVYLWNFNARGNVKIYNCRETPRSLRKEILPRIILTKKKRLPLFSNRENISADVSGMFAEQTFYATEYYISRRDACTTAHTHAHSKPFFLFRPFPDRTTDGSISKAVHTDVDSFSQFFRANKHP